MEKLKSMKPDSGVAEMNREEANTKSIIETWVEKNREDDERIDKMWKDLWSRVDPPARLGIKAFNLGAAIIFFCAVIPFVAYCLLNWLAPMFVPSVNYNAPVGALTIFGLWSVAIGFSMIILGTITLMVAGLIVFIPIIFYEFLFALRRRKRDILFLGAHLRTQPGGVTRFGRR